MTRLMASVRTAGERREDVTQLLVVGAGVLRRGVHDQLSYGHGVTRGRKRQYRDNPRCLGAGLG